MKVKDYVPCQKMLVVLIHEYGMAAVLECIIKHLMELGIEEPYMRRLHVGLTNILKEYEARYDIPAE
jgi:hypothetical protein